MSKFIVGDLVRIEQGEGIISITGIYSSGTPYSGVRLTKKFSKYPTFLAGVIYYVIDSFIEFLEPISIENQLLTKINTLYERQAWVKEGKQQALYYTKQFVPLAEKPDMTAPETISEYTQTDMSSALDAGLSQEEVERIQDELIRGWESQETLFGQARFVRTYTPF